MTFQIRVVDADDIRREKGIYTREKNLLFLKNMIELSEDGNHHVRSTFCDKYKLKEMPFTEIFAGPEPVFEVTKRMKAGKKAQGTLDGWVTGKSAGGGKSASDKPKVKKQSAAEIGKCSVQCRTSRNFSLTHILLKSNLGIEKVQKHAF